MTRAFQLGYLDLETNVLDAELDYYDRVIGATLVERGPDHRAYLSLGLDHHNITLSPAPQSRLAAIGLRIEQEEPADTLRHLEGSGLRGAVKSDARPGVPVLVEVEVGGHVLHLVPEMAMPGPGFRPIGIAPNVLGHVAVASEAADKLVAAFAALGFQTTDWFEDVATFMTCNRDHHVLNILAAPSSKLHHIAFGLRSRAHHHDAADLLTAARLPVVWGPSRHTAGHNLASYHFDPSGFLVEFYSDMDLLVPELGIFEPRPWHEDMPQRPRVWSLQEMTTWGTRYEFDFTSVL